MLTVTVSHDNLTQTVELWRNGALDSSGTVTTVGQAGKVEFPYPTLAPGVHEFKAKSVNSDGASPFSPSAVYITGIPSAPTITLTIG